MRYLAFFVTTLGLAALVGIPLGGCKGSTEPSSEDNIKGLIEGDYAAYFNDDESWSGDGGACGDGTATLPEGWYRAVEYFARSYTITVTAPYTEADVIVKDDIRGKMYIDRSKNNKWDPKTKPFDVEATRYATFKRDSTEHPWYLYAISPAVYRCKGHYVQTVTITEVTIQGENGYNTTLTDFTRPIPLDRLPVFASGEKVTVTCKAPNTSTENWEPASFAFVYHDKTREKMDDVGGASYRKEYRIQYNGGVHHGGISLIDAGTLQNETEDDYNSDGWSIPYVIE